MTRFAVVGTGPISRQFVDAAVGEGWELAGVVGSRAERAREFVAAFGPAGAGAETFGDVDAAAARSGGWDVVYVASPNSLHVHHALAFLRAGRHVIVEKPAFSNLSELRRAYRAADEYGVLLFEAARHFFEPNFATVRDQVAAFGGVAGASLVFRQYSSKWAAYREGLRPRIFTAEYSGGALADLGVYELYAAIDWLGMPASVSYRARILPDTGADAEGVAFLEYPTFTAELAVSKVQGSRQRSEIYATDGTTLSMNAVASISSIDIAAARATPVDVPAAPLPPNPMTPEVQAFGRLISAHPAAPAGGPDYARLRFLAEQVATVSQWLREDAGIVFPADRPVDEG